MKKYIELEIDFYEVNADEKAGYPPDCNKGYEAKDGKCVPVSENEAKKKENPFKKKGDDKKKDGDEKKENPFKKKDEDKKKGYAEKHYPGKNVKRRKDGVPQKKQKKRSTKKGEYRDKSGNLKKTKSNYDELWKRVNNPS